MKTRKEYNANLQANYSVIRVRKDLYKELKLLAIEEDRSTMSQLTYILKNYFKEQNDNNNIIS